MRSTFKVLFYVNASKEVAKMCGIEKRTSFHLSRHTFAVLALNYGMPIESVSKILGHTNITTTQISQRLPIPNSNTIYLCLRVELADGLPFRVRYFEDDLRAKRETDIISYRPQVVCYAQERRK